MLPQSFPFDNNNINEEQEKWINNHNNVKKIINAISIILFTYFFYRIIWIAIDGVLFIFLSFICMCIFKWNNGWNWNQLQQHVCDIVGSFKTFILNRFPKFSKNNHQFSFQSEEGNENIFQTYKNQKFRTENNFNNNNSTITSSSLSSIHI